MPKAVNITGCSRFNIIVSAPDTDHNLVCSFSTARSCRAASHYVSLCAACAASHCAAAYAIPCCFVVHLVSQSECMAVWLCVSVFSLSHKFFSPRSHSASLALSDTLLQAPGALASINVDNSSSGYMTITGLLRTMQIDKTDGLDVTLEPEALACKFVASKVSGFNLAVEKEGDEGTELISLAVPSQFCTTLVFDGDKPHLVTVPNCSVSA